MSTFKNGANAAVLCCHIRTLMSTNVEWMRSLLINCRLLFCFTFKAIFIINNFQSIQTKNLLLEQTNSTQKNNWSQWIIVIHWKWIDLMCFKCLPLIVTLRDCMRYMNWKSLKTNTNTLTHCVMSKTNWKKMKNIVFHKTIDIQKRTCAKI